ncbi:MAG: asparagine synthase-related protein [Beijerinckiaceae bacterium]|nr:asparagine synthase-related protein [Beijerinckiaceae bacterium]
MNDVKIGGTTTLKWRDGTILIEGVMLRVDNETGAGALDRLVELIEHDGPAAIARVEGDFVALIKTPDALHAFKSFTSQFQLYYREGERRVSNRLFAFWRTGDEEWNEDYFARHVLIVPGYQFISRETPIANVRRVLPGELVSIGRDMTRRQLIRRDYKYRFEGGATREDAAEKILHLLRESIRTRLAARPEARICVEISGGLDSSFIACLLGEATSGIRGVMFSQPGIPSHVVSEGFARDVAQRYGIDLVVVPPEDLPPPPEGIAPYCDEPSDFFWFGDIFSRSVAQFAEPNSFVFTGFGADQLFLRSPAILPHLLKNRQLRAFRASLPAASSLLSRSRFSVAWQSAISQLPAGLHRRLQRASNVVGWNPWDVSDVNMKRTLTHEVSWLLCGKGLDAYSSERREAERPLVGNGIICDDWGYFSAPRIVTQAHFRQKGLVDASPFCDLPLLDFTYDQISALLIHDFDGRYKELLRDAQKGVVPETLRNRQNDTFVFNSFQMTYVDKQRERFEQYLNGVDEAWIDKRGAREALQQLSFGMTTSSTRSVLALMGYLQWKDSFLAHCGRSGQVDDPSYFEARMTR